MAKTSFGYVRVSTREQCEDRQLIALRAFPVPEENIFTDKLSGKDFNRPQYRRLLKKLRPGDVLVVKSIDRLGAQLCGHPGAVAHHHQGAAGGRRGAGHAAADTRHTGSDLTGVFIADLVLQILSYVAETERENIRQRQREGIAAARLRGVRFGRPCKERPPSFAALKAAWERRQITARAAARELHVSPDTFLRWARGG